MAAVPNRCEICGRPIGPRAKTCGVSCRLRAYHRRRGAEYPIDPIAQQAWEAERRMLADRAINSLEAVAERIPERPTDAGRLRRRVLTVAAEIREAFAFPRQLTEVERAEKAERVQKIESIEEVRVNKDPRDAFGAVPRYSGSAGN